MRPWLQLAEMYRGRRSHDEALSCLEKALASEEGDRPAVKVDVYLIRVQVLGEEQSSQTDNSHDALPALGQPPYR